MERLSRKVERRTRLGAGGWHQCEGPPVCGSDSMDWDPSGSKSGLGGGRGNLSHWHKAPDPHQKDRSILVFPRNKQKQQ